MTSNQAAEMRLAQQEDAKLLARQQAGNPEASLLESLDTLLRAVNPLEKMDRTAENFLRTARAGAKQRLQKAEQAEEMLYQAQEALKNRDMDTYLRLSEEANAAMAMDRAFADWLLLKLIPEYDPGEENPLRNQAESARRKWAQEEHGFLGDAAYAAADMGSTALTAGVTGLPFLALTALESGADKAAQVLDETGDAQKALEMGIGSGAVSAGVESMFGIAGKWGSPLLKKMAGSAAGQKLLGLLPNRTLAWLEKLSRKKLAQVLGNAAGEGIESLAEDELQRVFENLMLDRDTPRDIREELYRALVSFAVGGVFDVGRTALDTIGGKTVNDGMKSPQESDILNKYNTPLKNDIDAEATIEGSFEDENSAVSNTLTIAQKNRLSTLDNTINDHLTEQDFSGTLRDLQGNPVPNGKGGYFDHAGEMADSYRSLKKIQKALEGSMKNPNLTEIDKRMLMEGLKKVNSYIMRIEDLFAPYGGIE